MIALTYADEQNQQYEKTESNFISVNERLKESLALSPVFEHALQSVVDEFKRRNKQWTKFSDIKLCSAISVPMSDIWIDTTMQRSVDMEHITNIIQYFSETMVMPIQVYKDGDRYIAWDGQHTIIALYILATKVFGERASSISIPVNVYSTSHKTEIRKNFILLNGNAKKPLEFIDIYKQQVYGVKVDGADDPEWVATAEKNDYFADAGLFTTHKKFGDEHEAGAFTLLADTLMTKSLKSRKHTDVTRMFARYWAYLNQKRSVEQKEARQLYEYFNLCYEQNIEVDDKYLLDLVAFTKDYFEADFSPNGPFWSKVSDAYSDWYLSKNEDSDDVDKEGNVIVRGFTTEMRCGIPFLIAQLKKSTKLKTPKYTPNNGFTVNKEMLWQ